ncbi:MAG: anti-sigma factor family protein, partial [Candidatus Dormibacteria bacterium]
MADEGRTSSSCAEVRDLLPAYALDSLEMGPATQVREHLKECPDCRAESAELIAAVAALAEQVDPVPPPP